jgi:type 1 glutamine amidotransferase
MTPRATLILLLAFTSCALGHAPARSELVWSTKKDFARAPRAAKVVFLIGADSHWPGAHEYVADAHLFAKLLEQTTGVGAIVVEAPASADDLRGARSIVLLHDGGSAHPFAEDRTRAVLEGALIDGAGLVALHYALDVPSGRPATSFQHWLGGRYESGTSANSTWSGHFVPSSSHPVARGLAAFDLEDEVYTQLLLDTDVKPVLTATGPRGTPEVVAWAVESGTRRAFGFSGGHSHARYADENLRRLVVNAILWTAHVDVPTGGAPVALEPATDPKSESNPFAKTLF